MIQRGTDLVGVEVKASATIRDSDFKNLRRFKKAAGKDFVGGVVVYNGTTSGSLGNGLYAVPVQMLWES